MKIDKKYSNEEIKKFNKEVFQTYKSGDVDTRNQIFEHNIGLINLIMNSKEFNYLESTTEDDAFQYGCLGLLHAIDNYDISKGVEFSTYALYCIKGKICNCISDDDSIIRLPRHIKKLLIKYHKVKAKLELTTSDEVTDDMICEQLYISKDKLTKLQEINYLVISTNMKINEFTPIFFESSDEGHLELIDALENKEKTTIPEEALIQKETKKEIDKVLNTVLTKKQKEIFLARYDESSPVYKENQRKIGEFLGVSHSYVSSVENTAINKLSKNPTLCKVNKSIR